jgi:hypothetical protein
MPNDNPDPWPRYMVKLSSLKCDIGREFVWYCWCQGAPCGYWRSVGAYRTPEDAVAAACADAAKRRDATLGVCPPPPSPPPS